MAFAKSITVKESITEIKGLQKKGKPLFIPRLRMLLVIKKSEFALSKNALAEQVGVNHNSIQKWRKLYEQGGIEALLSHKATASRPSVFTPEDKKKIEAKLKDPNNGLQGYKELHHWVKDHLKKEVKYNTLMVYCRNQFGTKIKVARKSHIKKDDNAVEVFKKTLVAFAEKR